MLFRRSHRAKHSGIETRTPKTLFLAGPTGAGKTALAVEIATRLNAEIVGADAFQIYAGLPILTAQPTPAQQARVPHHMVGCVPAAESFDVHRYASTAQTAIADVHARGRVALVVGGTGLYFRALISGLADTPPPNPELRAEMAGIPLPALVERLHGLDPEAPAMVDTANRRRVERAIEIVQGSGRPLREFRSTPKMNVPGILLTRDRENLAARIEANVRAMFAAGVADEVRAIGEVSPTAERAIGLREIRALLRGELSTDDCQAAITVATRQYAKRQLTWFRNQTSFAPLDVTQSFPDAVESALSLFALER